MKSIFAFITLAFFLGSSSSSAVVPAQRCQADLRFCQQRAFNVFNYETEWAKDAKSRSKLQEATCTYLFDFADCADFLEACNTDEEITAYKRMSVAHQACEFKRTLQYDVSVATCFIMELDGYEETLKTFMNNNCKA